MKTVAFHNATEAERKAFAINVTESLKEFVAQGNSVTLAQRMVIIKHKTNRPVISICCKIMKLNFVNLKGRKNSWLERSGVDVVP